jgi:uncharacterized protein YerC
MAQISKYPVSEKVYNRCWDIFTKAFITIKNLEDANQIITDLFSPTERVVVMKRLAIAYLLIHKYGYLEISKILKVSYPTIAMVSRSLKDGVGYKIVIEKISKEEDFQEFFNQLGQKIVEVPAKSGKGSGVYKYLKQELKNSSRTTKPF